MPEPTTADLVWTRACGDDPVRTFVGDDALAALLLAHGLIMNGGVLHAVECLTAAEASDAEAGYRFFGLDAAASLLLHARTNLDTLKSQEIQLDRQYVGIVPSDSSLCERFETHFQANPSAYAPLRTKDRIWG